MALTDRQQQVYDFLRSQQTQTGLMPSTREIQQHFGFSSQTAAVSHLRALERKGVIKRLPGKARAVIFPDDLEREQIVDIPIYGYIAAGMAVDTDQMEQEGCVSVDVSTLGLPKSPKAFALRVRGESMIDAHICDGDTVILEHKNPRNGDIVAALIDGETTLKRYITKGGRPYLHAENSEFPDLMPVQELVVQGVMIALLRKGSG